MSDDFRVPINIRSRVSTKKLLRSSSHKGFACWIFAQAEVRYRCPDGDTSAWEPLDWALAGEWDEDPRKFVDALVAAGLLIRAADAEDLGLYDKCAGDGWVPLDWRAEQIWAITEPARKDQARRAGLASGEARRTKRENQKSLFPKGSNGNERQFERGVQQTVEPSTLHSTTSTTSQGPRSRASSDHQAFIKWWVERWQQVRGTKYDFGAAAGKNAAAVKRLLSLGSLDEVKARANRMLTSSDNWTRENADLGVLLSRWNHLTAPGDPNHDHWNGEPEATPEDDGYKPVAVKGSSS